MKSIRTLLRNVAATAITAFAIAPAAGLASGGAEPPLDRAPINLHDQASLQRGARNFVNYCLNCHNAAFMRYSALTKIGLTETQIKENLILTDSKISDAMVSALDPSDAKDWFGGVPPDLTLVARVRGSDWVYTFLRSFYRSDASPTGWANPLFPGVAMPHVLHDLQGSQAMVKAGERPGHDGKPEPIMKLAVERAGTMTQAEYDRFVGDLVNYLTYMGEPSRADRTQMGVLVLLFLSVFFFIAYFLKHEYWKDVK
jgi:ubiquinol-cytochrome c reductase cytochrome c1 subunit